MTYNLQQSGTGMRMVCAGAVLTALLCTASVPAATLFVDSGFGGDSTHFVSIQSAFAAAGSNDTIYVRGRRTFAGPLASSGLGITANSLASSSSEYSRGPSQ